MANSSAAGAPLYHDVSPVYERYKRIFFVFTGLVCLISIICAVVQAQTEKKFYIITLSIITSIFFVICIYLFFKRRILLAEKLWFVNLTIFILLVQAIIYLIFVFIKPYPLPITTTTVTTTPYWTTTANGSNTTDNMTTTMTSTSTTKVFLTKLYEPLDGI